MAPSIFDTIVPFVMGMIVMGLINFRSCPPFPRFVLAGGITLSVLLLALSSLTGCADSPADRNKREAVHREVRLAQVEAELARQQEPYVLTTLQENGCQLGAELYGKMMHGKLVSGSRQGTLCLMLAADAREVPVCKRFFRECEVALCDIEPHQGCTMLWRVEGTNSPRLKAPQ